MISHTVSESRCTGERGIVLVVILAMLQLLTLLGITFATLASHRGHAVEIQRVQQDIQLAQTALSGLLQTPNDRDLQMRTLVTVDQALRSSKAFIDGWDEPPTPETRRLHGLLTAAGSLFDRLVIVLRDPDPPE
jgi:hypothetical protein